jgi:hypothetical protein
MTERMTAWQCIGCGRIEGAQPCIGVCQDRRVDLVYAADYEAALARLQTLAALVRELAFTTPRKGECERTYRVLQARARAALQALAQQED